MLYGSQASVCREPPVGAASDPPPRRILTEADATDIWIARWLRVPRKVLIRRYGCDPRRLYEIWECRRFGTAREKALLKFGELHPALTDRVDFGPHRRIPRKLTSPLQYDFLGALLHDR
jgi:hypothetical protein